MLASLGMKARLHFRSGSFGCKWFYLSFRQIFRAGIQWLLVLGYVIEDRTSL